MTGAARSPRTPKAPRAYHSATRTARAAQTRQRIAAAARDLFTEVGFAATTVSAIARRAGVTAQTVHATFGTKGAIVAALLAQMEQDAGADQWRRQISQEADPARRLLAFARWSAALYSSSGALIGVVFASMSDPAVSELQNQGDRHRRAALTGLIDSLRQQGHLRTDRDPDHLVDSAWLLTGVSLYLAAVGQCGWTDEVYAQWLGGMLMAELLDR